MQHRWNIDVFVLVFSKLISCTETLLAQRCPEVVSPARHSSGSRLQVTFPDLYYYINYRSNSSFINPVRNAILKFRAALNSTSRVEIAHKFVFFNIWRVQPFWTSSQPVLTYHNGLSLHFAIS